MYYAYVTTLKDVRKHPNADNIGSGTADAYAKIKEVTKK